MADSTVDLLGTTDAMVWAEEWCRIAREIEASDDDRKLIDAGWMVGWFANAMCVAADAERRKIAESIVGSPITIDVDRLAKKDSGPPPRPTTDGGEAIMLADEVRWPGSDRETNHDERND